MRNIVSPFFWFRNCFVLGLFYFLYSFFFGGARVYEKVFEVSEIEKAEGVIENPRVGIHSIIQKLEPGPESKKSDFGTDFERVNSNLICSGENEQKCAAPLKRHRSIIYTAPKYRLSACTIYKNMSSMLRAMMCYLFDPELSNKFRPKFTDYYRSNNCLNASMNTFYGYKRLLQVYPDFSPRNWTMLALVRDPLEKFVSGFVDKCIRSHACKSCSGDIYCFIKERYKEIMESSYKLSSPKPSYLNAHFFPQNWHCDMITYYKNYTFIKFSSDPEVLPNFYKKLTALLEQNNVEDEMIKSILGHLEEEKPQNTNSGKFVLDDFTKIYTRKIKENPKLMEYIIRMYYHDFRLFGYPIPELKN